MGRSGGARSAPGGAAPGGSGAETLNHGARAKGGKKAWKDGCAARGLGRCSGQHAHRSHTQGRKWGAGAPKRGASPWPARTHRTDRRSQKMEGARARPRGGAPAPFVWVGARVHGAVAHGSEGDGLALDDHDPALVATARPGATGARAAAHKARVGAGGESEPSSQKSPPFDLKARTRNASPAARSLNGVAESVGALTPQLPSGPPGTMLCWRGRHWRAHACVRASTRGRAPGAGGDHCLTAGVMGKRARLWTCGLCLA